MFGEDNVKVYSVYIMYNVVYSNREKKRVLLTAETNYSAIFCTFSTAFVFVMYVIIQIWSFYAFCCGLTGRQLRLS